MTDDKNDNLIKGKATASIINERGKKARELGKTISGRGGSTNNYLDEKGKFDPKKIIAEKKAIKLNVNPLKATKTKVSFSSIANQKKTDIKAIKQQTKSSQVNLSEKLSGKATGKLQKISKPDKVKVNLNIKKASSPKPTNPSPNNTQKPKIDKAKLAQATKKVTTNKAVKTPTNPTKSQTKKSLIAKGVAKVKAAVQAGKVKLSKPKPKAKAPTKRTPMRRR